MTTSSTGISYGLFASLDDDEDSFVVNRRDDEGNNVYETAYGKPVGKDDIRFLRRVCIHRDVLCANAKCVASGESVGFKMRFVVGDGDAASVLDVVQELDQTVRGRLIGEFSICTHSQNSRSCRWSLSMRTVPQ